jgi:PBSX family phage terminase large subunit
MEMSQKQKQSLRESNARLNIWIGAVRSGKTYASIWRFIKYIQKGPPGDLMIVGKSIDTIRRNIISELMDFLGVDVRYYAGNRIINLWERKIYVVGANDERAVQKIQGSTLAGAYIDEVSLIPESFWSMLLSRLSIPGAQLFATTNPDSPFHWLKTKVLDDINLDLKSWHFKLEDNPSLDDSYKDNLKREYKGLWYQRYIEGLWVLAEGTIYDFFDPKLHVMQFIPTNTAKFYIVGVDYGTTNPCAFTLIGYNPDHYPNMWVEKEYYWDSVKENRQKTDTEYAEDLVKFISNIPSALKDIYLDPSAASFKVELQRHGVRNIVDANNDVLDGIRFVSGLLSNGSLQVHISCKNLINEFGSYVWDHKSRDLGIDKPMKRSDHVLDSVRYGLFTHFGKNLGSENRMTPDTLREMKRKYGFY